MEENNVNETTKGCFSTVFGLVVIVGFNVFMFWLCMKIFGWII